MAAGDEDVEALDRLEGALDRIEARQAARPDAASSASSNMSPEAQVELTDRLDAVIARLRAGLEG